MAIWVWLVIGVVALCIVGGVVAAVIVVRKRQEEKRLDALRASINFSASSYNTPYPQTKTYGRSEVRSGR